MHGSRILKALLAGAAVAAAPLALSAQEARTQPCDAIAFAIPTSACA